MLEEESHFVVLLKKKTFIAYTLEPYQTIVKTTVPSSEPRYHHQNHGYRLNLGVEVKTMVPS